jgi:ferredoxin
MAKVAVKQNDGTVKHYKIVYNRDDCIGAAACIAAFPERWEMADDGKADLKGGKPNDDNSVQELEITQEEFQKMMDSAQACPVNVIHIIDLETNKRLI